MDLRLNDQRFVIGGATSGFGLATARILLAEGARIIAVARTAGALAQLAADHPGRVEAFAGDLTDPATTPGLLEAVGEAPLAGILVNAGGPPAKAFTETTLADWDEAYRSLLRWKVQLTQAFLPKFKAQGYGRLLYIESMSVKQPIEHLVLSNALRLAVVGMVKTVSQEVASAGITLNILAPGYHDTPAMDRLFRKKSDSEGISLETARAAFESGIKTGKMGDPADFASLAAWLLSPHSHYITGQTIAVDGGVLKGTF